MLGEIWRGRSINGFVCRTGSPPNAGDSRGLDVAQAFQPASHLPEKSAGWIACPTRLDIYEVRGLRGSSREPLGAEFRLPQLGQDEPLLVQQPGSSFAEAR